MTTNEFTVLNAIAHDLYQPSNGATPESFEDDTAAVWTFSVSDEVREKGMKPLVFSGTVSVLVQKGWVESYVPKVKRTGDDATLELTKAGYDAWRAEFDARKEVK